MTHSGSRRTIMYDIIQIKNRSGEEWTGHGVWTWVHSDLGLGDMTLDQVHYAPFGHEQQLCKVLFRSERGVRCYDRDTIGSYIQTCGQTG